MPGSIRRLTTICLVGEFSSSGEVLSEQLRCLVQGPVSSDRHEALAAAKAVRFLDDRCLGFRQLRNVDHAGCLSAPLTGRGDDGRPVAGIDGDLDGP